MTFPASFQSIAQNDPDIYQALCQEEVRQEQHIELIASENYASPAVMAAQASVLTNKYAEGYPGKRYYGGCEFVDVAENIAIERLKKIFGAEYANVQPHSGAQANGAIFFALLNPGDTILGLNLAHGGHLTHGMPLNISGKWFRAVSYNLNPETELLDYEEIARVAEKEKPKMIIAGASAYSRQIDFSKFRQIADAVGAYLMVDMAHYAGLIAAGLYPNPIPHADVIGSTTHKTLRGPRGGIILAKAQYEKLINSAVFPGIQGGPLMHVIAAKAVAFGEALKPEFKVYQQKVLDNSKALAKTLIERGFRIVSGGTDSHLSLVDLRSKSVTGKVLEAALGQACITVNKNSIPNDPEKPMTTSGIRVGSPAGTTRGFGVKEFEQIGHWIADITQYVNDPVAIEKVKQEVLGMTAKFPVYQK
jgi:glycine hydroxymethyltransferase